MVQMAHALRNLLGKNRKRSVSAYVFPFRVFRGPAFVLVI